MPLSPNSSKTKTAFSPFSSKLPKPLINACSASIGRFPHISAKLVADIPATLANFSKSLPPRATAVSIALNVCVIAVPPASASIPTEDMAAANASVSASVKLAILAPAASRLVIETISASVVA